MPITDASVGLPGIRPDSIHDAALVIEDASPCSAVFRAFAGIHGSDTAAVPLGAQIVKVSQQLESVLAEGKRTIAIEQIRPMLVHQILDPQIPVLLPCVRNAVFVPVKLAREEPGVAVRVIEIRSLRSGSVIGNTGKRAFSIAEVADCEPLVTDPQMVAHAKRQAVLAGSASEV